MRARVAVENLNGVISAKPDMNAHTLTVEFDDEKTNLEAIIGTLGKAGYTVPDHHRVAD